MDFLWISEALLAGFTTAASLEKPWRLPGLPLPVAEGCLPPNHRKTQRDYFPNVFNSSGQMIPTPRGSVLDHTISSQLPYNAKSPIFQVLGEFPISRSTYGFPMDFLWIFYGFPKLCLQDSPPLPR